MSVRDRGFTLLEIMVVVFILGLLATVVAPRLLGRTDDARVTAAHANLKSIEQALNLYRLDNGGYPTTEQGLEALVEKPALAPAPRAWRTGGYLDHVPRDPWGRPFVYVLVGADRFALASLGRDGVEGGDGYDRDLDGRDH